MLGELVELACLMEATARKPGNVHPGASFSDLRYDDFVRAATAIALVFDEAEKHTIGQTVRDAIAATRKQAATNINLGIVLLLAPLAKVSRSAAVADVLRQTTQHDAALVYEAIRLAHPGGMGKVDNQDVADIPTQTLREVMCPAADRDQIAAQYATDFQLVQSLADRVSQRLIRMDDHPGMPSWEQAVIATFLELMATNLDSLIIRKVGLDIAKEAQRRAGLVIAADWPSGPQSAGLFRELDDWLRADGHRRNPGTSADLMAAALFVALRNGRFQPPTKTEIRAHADIVRGA